MAYEVRIAPAAKRDIKKLAAPLQVQIYRKLLDLESNPRPQDCKKLKAPRDIYRIRLGEYRILYEIRDRELIVLVLRAGHRREIYR
jgi:mRNA interferase RelE/StbE